MPAVWNIIAQASKKGKHQFPGRRPAARKRRNTLQFEARYVKPYSVFLLWGRKLSALADVLKSVCERIRGIVPGGNAPIVRGSASEWAARSAVCLSFILLAFFQTVSVSVLTVFLTVLLSFCVILFTVRRTDTLALFRAKPVRSLAVLGFSVIVCLAAHDSVGVFRSEQWRQTSAYARIPLDPYAAGFFLFASLSLAFLVLKLLDVSRLPDRIRAFFAALGRRSILWYALFSLAVLAGLCVLFDVVPEDAGGLLLSV